METKPLQSVAYEQLLAMVQNHELEFGKIYSETHMAKRFEVSRTPMRDALNRLATERYIDILPSRGFQLHKSTREDILEAYHIRSAIERYCSRCLAENHLQEEAASLIDKMEALCTEQAHMAAADSMDLQKFWDCDYNFHLCLIRYIDLPCFYQQFNFYMHFYVAHHYSSYRTLFRDRSTVDEHQQLIEALQAGKPADAERCLQYHMDQSLRIVLNSFETE